MSTVWFLYMYISWLTHKCTNFSFMYKLNVSFVLHTFYNELLIVFICTMIYITS